MHSFWDPVTGNLSAGDVKSFTSAAPLKPLPPVHAVDESLPVCQEKGQ